MPLIDHYERLGVTPLASAAEIRAAYRARARVVHPDRTGGDSVAMAAVNEAWAVLSDPSLRAAYDASLDAARHRRGDHRCEPDESAAAHEPFSGASTDPSPDAVRDEPLLASDLRRSGRSNRTMGRVIVFAMAIAGIALALLFVYAFLRSGDVAR